MRFSRARYVTLCQQSLVTAAVLTVGLSAAGVKTLDIVPQPGAAAEAQGQAQGKVAENAPNLGTTAPSKALAGDAAPGKTDVDSAPVTPKVREVSVTSAPTHTAARQAPQKPATPPPSTQKKAAAPTPRVLESAPQKVQGYATIGVTWEHGVTYAEDQIKIEIRTQKKNAWSKWTKVQYHDDHGPDSTSDEEESSRERPGTDALVIGDVDQVQMRATTADGSVPPDLKLAIIDPGTGKMVKQAPAIDTAKLPSAKTATSDGDGAGEAQSSGQLTLHGDDANDVVALSAMMHSPKPYIYSRAQWGANEKMREQSAPQYGTVKTGFVHHTVNANNYTAAQVPALLRGIYAYHTQSRGWRDIGYNYLVDRFGRIWEGRWGGVDKAVVGAHTLGYNEVSFAMSAIGNFDIARPPQAVLDAYARLFAWKLSLYNIPANQTNILVKGKRLQAINGHRDVGQTACPGRYLYAKLGWIRTKARAIQVAAQKGGGTPPPPAPKPPVFTSPTQTARPAKAQPSTIKFPRSLNLAGSAYPDIVMRDYAGVVKLLATGGQSGYTTATYSRGPWKSMTLLAAVNDVTGDGKGDVIGRIGGGATKVYRGNGAGRVSKVGIAPTKIFRRANKVVAAGDYNGDRRNDVLMRSWKTGGLYLVRGLGAGKFASPRLLAMGWGKYSSLAVPGDVTGDGRPDVVGVKQGVMYVFPNIGGLRLGHAVERQTVGSAYSAVVGSGHDINGDGVGDLLVRDRASGGLGIRTGQSKSTFGATIGWFRGVTRWKNVSAGQMTGSSQADFVGIGPAGRSLVVRANNGLRNVAGLFTTNLKLPTASMVIDAGDWNGDGKGDLIARDSDTDRLVLYPGLGNAKFGTGVAMSTGWSFVNLAAVGDVTGDGRPDLMGRVSGGKMTIFPSAGGAKFQAPILAPAKMRTFNQIGSGLWSTSSMPTTSVFNIGAFFVPTVAARGKLGSPYNRVVGPGDVDGDGRADLVMRDTSGTLWLVPGRTSGYGARRFLASGFKSYMTFG